MDFLTRLAQRMTGELPAVQPRLPSLFEPAAGAARAMAENEEMAMFAVPEPAKPTAAAIPTGFAPPTAVLSARRDALSSIDPFRPPVSVPERVRPASFPVPEETRSGPSGPLDEAPARAIVQPAPNLAPSRRVVSVDIRPAAGGAASPSLSAGSRRRAATAPMNDEARRGQSSGTGENLQGPPTVHVHIGRVDVRALLPPAAPPTLAARPAAPRTTLEDYLSGRKGGSQP